MVFHDGWYYYCAATADNLGIEVRRTTEFWNLSAAVPALVWHAPARGPFSHAVWAPELHRIAGRWYIYFAADGGQNQHHRMWVLEAATDDPQGVYRMAGRLETERWAIDGTVFDDGRSLHFIWSGWPGRKNGQQNLYISRMRDPLTLEGGRTLLAEPDQPWERVEMPICEGPQVLRRGGRTFIVYSASGSWCEDYCLGMLVNEDGNYLQRSSWRKVGPVLSKSEDVWGIGHNCFVTSPCGADWILYHSKSSRRHGWVDRDVHAQRFGWSAEGYPQFDRPHGRGVAVLMPTQPTLPIAAPAAA